MSEDEQPMFHREVSAVSAPDSSSQALVHAGAPHQGVLEPPPGYGWLPWSLPDTEDVAPSNAASPHPGQLPPIPRGGMGYLRGQDEHELAGCCDDLYATALWVDRSARRNSLTAEKYRREIERFLLWLGLARGRALSEATVEDIRCYDDVLRHPEQHPDWYGPQVKRSDPRWRPWTRPLSAQARYNSLRIVHRVYDWLVRRGYLRFNVVDSADVVEAAPRRRAQQYRFLPEAVWQDVLTLVDTPPADDASAFSWLRYTRNRWILYALYHLGARASELAEARQGDLFIVQRGSQRHWRWQVRGKHRRAMDDPDDIPVPGRLISVLSEYRHALGLSPYPTPGERTPMVVTLYPVRDGWKGVSRKQLFEISKALFRETAARMCDESPEHARILESASTHWLRHTFVTHLLAQGVSIQDARELARHRDIGSTQVYAHSEQDRLAEITERFANRGDEDAGS